MRVAVAGDAYFSERPALDEKLLAVVQHQDVAILNLESPLTEKGEPIVKTGPHLIASPEATNWITSMGFGMVALANNHILDQGKKGLRDTLEHLEKASIQYVGAGLSNGEAAEPYIFRKDKESIAILNIAENEWSTTSSAGAHGANPIDPVANWNSIQAAKKNADHVLVITHGGHEGYPLPSPRMKALFRFFIEAGADAVVNHHTHCTSGYEWYLGKPICYSLGNFFFPSMGRHQNDKWHEGMIAVLQFGQEGVQLELVHYDQCKMDSHILSLDADLVNERNNRIDKLNACIADDTALLQQFEQWVDRHRQQYKSYIEPHHNRFIQALQNRGLLPSFWQRRKKTYLLNLIRCEAHRDMLTKILEDEIGHP